MHWIDIAFWSIFWTQLITSAAHDHLYLIGEKKTTYFAWTRTRFSPLIQWVRIIRKGDAAIAKADERKERARRARRNPPQ